jgi:hypothetical protein
MTNKRRKRGQKTINKRRGTRKQCKERAKRLKRCSRRSDRETGWMTHGSELVLDYEGG